MRISAQRHVEEGRTAGYEVVMTCKNEREFLSAFDQIKEVEGVEWCGCPDETETYYSDLIAYLPKVPGILVSELHDDAKRIAKECKSILRDSAKTAKSSAR